MQGAPLISNIEYHCNWHGRPILKESREHRTRVKWHKYNRRSTFEVLETFMGVDQRTGEGTNPHIPVVVSKSHSDHGTATTAHRTLGLTPAGTICRNNLSLSHYPLHRLTTRQNHMRGIELTYTVTYMSVSALYVPTYLAIDSPAHLALIPSNVAAALAYFCELLRGMGSTSVCSNYPPEVRRGGY